ncbi:arsenate reductase ArsC [Novosphingobium sp. FSY-8]|uniref:Arsenate reductase ArsC n=1 Tax=Novosphingobium ovatum TaxID=1908523 RepID=A0ABW9X9B8_9SPHN|nr:arsenate reductase ArsC [Novosphingobium ovatum]NBC35123.1 arsenate reductase ArsC [Novosphingobium ovatum]
MTDRVFNVLFLCTGNSARSIFAESLLTHLGGGRFRAFSAGSHPKGEVHPMALELLKEYDFPHEGFRSKNWREFEADGAPEMDFVITVCDNAAGETCPVWPGQPMTAHWGIEDPAQVEGPGQKLAFYKAMSHLRRRIELFVSLPTSGLARLELEQRVRKIGKEEGATQMAKDAQ